MKNVIKAVMAVVLLSGLAGAAPNMEASKADAQPLQGHSVGQVDAESLQKAIYAARFENCDFKVETAAEITAAGRQLSGGDMLVSAHFDAGYMLFPVNTKKMEFMPGYPTNAKNTYRFQTARAGRTYDMRIEVTRTLPEKITTIKLSAWTNAGPNESTMMDMVCRPAK